MNEIIITVNRGLVPVLVTGDADVVAAVVEALVRVLRGPGRGTALRLARDVQEQDDYVT